ncbi:hypothetical protein BDN72DRAFT_58747 [Pluteus cervinus]|uniref:Uncharacterized protein n=1 Tax=Pluteus cervinus TaxID=181527 RepID=A0ACD3BAB6_9AGAR|nr:hypothetical protein BDN72DRAFT_58747 [Pluteus cervinus]
MHVYMVSTLFVIFISISFASIAPRSLFSKTKDDLGQLAVSTSSLPAYQVHANQIIPLQDLSKCDTLSQRVHHAESYLVSAMQHRGVLCFGHPLSNQFLADNASPSLSVHSTATTFRVETNGNNNF